MSTLSVLRAKGLVKVSALHAALAEFHPTLPDLRAKLETKVVEVRTDDFAKAWRWAGIATGIPVAEFEVDAKLRHFTSFLRSEVHNQNADGSMTLTALSVLACGPMRDDLKWMLSALRVEGLLFDFEAPIVKVIASLDEALVDVVNFSCSS